MRMAMVEVERALEHVATSGGRAGRQGTALAASRLALLMQKVGHPPFPARPLQPPAVLTAEESAAAAGADPADAAAELAEQQGLFAYRLAVVSPRPGTGLSHLRSPAAPLAAALPALCCAQPGPTLGQVRRGFPPPLPRNTQAYEAARQLFRRHRGLIAIGGSEWPALRSDLLELAGPAPVGSKMRTAQRMMRSYSLFQQF